MNGDAIAWLWIGAGFLLISGLIHLAYSLILHEKVGPWRLAGCGVLIAGVILLSGA